MYRSTSYGYDDNQNGSSMLPFIIGCAVGVGVSALYAAGRNNRLGMGVSNAIHTVEGKAVQASSAVARKASDLKDTVADRITKRNQDNTWESDTTQTADMGTAA